MCPLQSAFATDLQNFLSKSCFKCATHSTLYPPFSFADRQFYEDWVSFPRFSIPCRPLSTGFQWNSTSWDEFARKWNKPVHTFLLRHVYSATRKSYRISKASAMFVTFLVSALAHELVMVVVTKKIRWVSL